MVEVLSDISPGVLPQLEFDAAGRKIYKPDGKVLRAFLRERKHVSVIRGSIGSGTSTALFMKAYMISMEQWPDPVDDYRKTRWIVVRNTFPDLKGTTIKTWLDWFPEEDYGRFFWERPYRHEIRIADMQMDVHFLALDSLDDIRKLRSLEVTGVIFNELEFTDKELVDEAESRTGRFPAVKDGGAKWDGVLADMNAPPADHFIPLMMGEIPLPEEWTEEERLSYKKPDTWGYHVQPPSMLEVKDGSGALIGYEINPEAENTRWLKPGYYAEKIKGKTRQWIKSRILNKITVVVAGKPVWDMFVPDTHVASIRLKPIPGYTVYVGLDFGRNPAMVMGQIVSNRWRVFGELKANGVGASTFAPLVKRALDRKLGLWSMGHSAEGFRVEIYGDPKGADGTQSDETTAYDVFAGFGLPVIPAPVKNNHINTRIEAVEFALNGMANGLPRFQLCPVSCLTLKVAMEGGYHYARIKGTSVHKLEPVKDRYSDIADALQYMVLGGGEGRAMIGGSSANIRKPVSTRPHKKSRRHGPQS